MSNLFSPIKIREENIRNRVFVSPMCQYSADDCDGMPDNWHLVHLGTRAVGGAGLVMVEATGVSPEGRISPQDTGIWSDEHIPAYIPITQFLSEYSATPAIQLAHAGRKASHNQPWNGGTLVSADDGGWQSVAPSSVSFGEGFAVPSELSLEDISGIIMDFASAAKRSVEAGFKVIELHFAHGYLASTFMSPLSNTRKDKYGGSLENRCRFAIDIASAVRSVIPESMPLFARISASEYMPGGWDIDDAIELSGWLKDQGVDLIDCSSGGISQGQQIDTFPGYQVPFASKIRSEVDVLTGAVGLIRDAAQAEQTLRNGDADAILLGRELLRNPYWALYAREELDRTNDLWPAQYFKSYTDTYSGVPPR